MVDKVIKGINIFEVVLGVKSEWKNTKKETIINCFIKVLYLKESDLTHFLEKGL